MTASPNGSPRFSIVCLSPQDWGSRMPTNRQQIMSRAAGKGHRVLFVETGGFLGRHLWRLVRGPGRASLARRLVSGEQVAPEIRVRKLLTVVPFAQRYKVANRLNWAIGAALIRREARALPAPTVTWIYDPRGVAALGSFGEAFAAYDCVDDYPEQANYARRSKALVAAADRASAERSRVVFATTGPLLERHSAVNPRTHLVPNVGDFAHFSVAADRSIAEPELLALPRPVLGFAGNLTPDKVDFDLLEELAGAFGSTVLLAGPVDPSARDAVARLARSDNVRVVGFRSYADLPRVIAAFDVGLIPYVENEYTRSCFPLKLYEYLAAGKSVVATGLPELAGREPHVVLARGTDAAIDAVRAALARGDEGKERSHGPGGGEYLGGAGVDPARARPGRAGEGRVRLLVADGPVVAGRDRRLGASRRRDGARARPARPRGHGALARQTRVARARAPRPARAPPRDQARPVSPDGRRRRRGAAPRPTPRAGLRRARRPPGHECRRPSAARLGVPLAFVFHASVPLEQRFMRPRLPVGPRTASLALSPAFARLERIAVGNAAAVLVLSEFSRGLLLGGHPSVADRIVRVTGGIDPAAFAPTRVVTPPGGVTGSSRVHGSF